MSHYIHDCENKEILRLFGNKLPEGQQYEVTSIQFINADKVMKIDDGFLNYCKKLEHIDLSPLKNVKEIGYDFIGPLYYSPVLTEEQKSWINEKQSCYDSLLELDDIDIDFE